MHPQRDIKFLVKDFSRPSSSPRYTRPHVIKVQKANPTFSFQVAFKKSSHPKLLAGLQPGTSCLQLFHVMSMRFQSGFSLNQRENLRYTYLIADPLTKYLKSVTDENFVKLVSISADSLLKKQVFVQLRSSVPNSEHLELINSCELVISCLQTLSEPRQDVVKTVKQLGLSVELEISHSPSHSSLTLSLFQAHSRRPSFTPTVSVHRTKHKPRISKTRRVMLFYLILYELFNGKN